MSSVGGSPGETGGSGRRRSPLPTPPGDQPLMPRNVSRHPAAILALGSGWIAYAYWTNNSGHPVSSFSTTWVVPPPPATNHGQTISCSMASRTPADDSDGCLETFLEAMNGSVWNTWQTMPHSGPWSQINSLGGIVRASVRVALNSDGRLESWDPNGQRRLGQLADRAARRAMERPEQAHLRTAVAAPASPLAGRQGWNTPTGAATASASGPGRRCGLPTRLTTRVAHPRPQFESKQSVTNSSADGRLRRGPSPPGEPR